MITPEQRHKIESAISDLEVAASNHGVAVRGLYAKDMSTEERERQISNLPEFQQRGDARKRLYDLLAAVTDYSPEPVQT